MQSTDTSHSASSGWWPEALGTTASPELLSALIDAAPLAIVSVDRDRRVLSWNHAAETLFGWTASEILGGINPLIPPECAEEYAQIRETVWSGGSVRGLRTERMHRDGSRVPVLVSTSAASDVHGEIVAAIAFFVDQSDVRVAEDRLRRADTAQTRRASQQQSVASFSRRAAAEPDEDALVRAALLHVTMALHAEGCELLERSNGTLVSRAQVGFEIASVAPIAVGADSVFDDVLQSHVPVSRWLLSSDYKAAPHLQVNGFRFAAVATVSTRGGTYVLAAYSRKHPFDLADVHPLQAIAGMLSATWSRRAIEQELAGQDARMRTLLDQMPAIIWSVDTDLVVTSLQGGPLAAIGRTPADAVGRRMIELDTHSPAVVAAREALTGKSVEYRYEHHGRTYDTRLEPLRDHGGEIVGAIALALDVTDQTDAERQVLASREELRRLYAKISEIQEDERRRISRELHDDLGQQLTALRFDAALLRDELVSSVETASRRVASILELVDHAIASVRRVATELRPAVLDDFGFRAALELEVSSFARRVGIHAEVAFRDEPPLDIDHATALYRITQEALTNVARHANARHLRLAFEQRDGWLRAEIADDGCGIDPAALHDPSSLGLIGMRERAHAFGGTVAIGLAPGGGTEVVVLFPLSRL